MGLHIFRLRFGGVVHITADVQIEIVLIDDLRFIDEATVFWNLTFMGENVVDLLDVLRAQLVLILAFGKLTVGIDEQDLVA